MNDESQVVALAPDDGQQSDEPGAPDSVTRSALRVHSNARPFTVNRQVQSYLRIVVRQAVKDGILVRPDGCAECGATGRLQAHHYHYLKPLDVRWLCKGCYADFAQNVNEPLTPKRPREAPEYSNQVRRIVAGFGRLVASGDIAGLANLVALADHVDEVILDTITTLHRDHGYSWSDIGRELGITRQAAQQRWGAKERTRTWEHSSCRPSTRMPGSGSAVARRVA